MELEQIEELALLEAMYPNELTVKKPNQISIQLSPSTGGDEMGIWVKCEIIFTISTNYPEVCPIIEVEDLLGLEPIELSKICSNLKERSEELKGQQMLFELIELAKELITSMNKPANCPICLITFETSDYYTTTCKHKYHRDCLFKWFNICYQESIKKQNELFAVSINTINPRAIKCPVCRTELIFH
eukprot:TRINITY_DN5116_c2_g1_i1.p1 TRINITY_DN5116_c2_g1~~TRINITY_DN5116_c2_g1_i1.p1  ORF type:complete len:187 (-),score=57.33 TRINITY_DN5116_c2_g1_i1:100-660(-)